MVEMYKGSDTLGLFKPYSYDELLKLPKEETEAQMKVQDAYDKMQSQATTQESLLEKEDPNSYAYKTVSSYVDSLNKRINDLAEYGLSTSTNPDLMRLKSTYNTTIKPIEEAQKRKGSLYGIQSAAKIADPTMVYNWDADATPLDSFIQNPYLQNTGLSMAKVSTEAKDLSSALATVQIDTEGKMIHTSNPYIDEFKTKNGITTGMLIRSRLNPDGEESNKILKQMVDFGLVKYGIVKANEDGFPSIKNGQYELTDEWKSNPDIIGDVVAQFKQNWEYALGKTEYKDESSAYAFKQKEKTDRMRKTTGTDAPYFDAAEIEEDGHYYRSDDEALKGHRALISMMKNFGVDFSSDGNTINKVDSSERIFKYNVLTRNGVKTHSINLDFFDDNGNLRPFSFIYKEAKNEYEKEKKDGDDMYNHYQPLNEKEAKVQYDRLLAAMRPYTNKSGKTTDFNAFRVLEGAKEANLMQKDQASIRINTIGDPEKYIIKAIPGALSPYGQAKNANNEMVDLYHLYTIKSHVKNGIAVTSIDKEVTIPTKVNDSGRTVPQSVVSIDMLHDGVGLNFEGGDFLEVPKEYIQSRALLTEISRMEKAEEKYLKDKNKEYYNKSRRAIITRLGKLNGTYTIKKRVKNADEYEDETE